MIEPTENTIPKIYKQYEVINNGSYSIIEIKQDKNIYLKCDEMVLYVLELIDGNRNLNNIILELEKKHNLKLSLENLNTIVNVGLHKLTSLEHTNLKKSSYIQIKVTLLNQKTTEILALGLSHLFKIPIATIVIFIINSILICIFFLSNSIVLTSNPKAMGVTALCIAISLILHELGHAAACIAYNCSVGRIGLGFYMFTPVLFTDVTSAWKLSRVKRVVVDLAGMFIESLLISILILAYLLLNYQTLLLACLSIALNSLININPLLRYDGYWLLSDCLNIPNLKQRSDESLKQFFNISSFRKKKHKPIEY